jgi:osmotically-inducible protein OsmY
MPDPKFPVEEEPRSELPVLAARTHALDPSAHDGVLRQRILNLIQSTRELDASDLAVVVQNRSVTLFGTAADDGQRAELERIAKSVSGVLMVTNRLKVATPTH